MNEKTMQLAVGLSVAVLGYALFQHFKGRMPGSAPGVAVRDSFGEIPFLRNDSTSPYAGYGYDPSSPGEVILLKDMLPGIVADNAAGIDPVNQIPLTSDLVSGVVREYYAVRR